eukprot:jgi/Bigna1/143889/aug1.82_g18597
MVALTRLFLADSSGVEATLVRTPSAKGGGETKDNEQTPDRKKKKKKRKRERQNGAMDGQNSTEATSSSSSSGSSSSGSSNTITELCCRAMRFPHVWVRTASARLIGHVLSDSRILKSAGARTTANKDDDAGDEDDSQNDSSGKQDSKMLSMLGRASSSALATDQLLTSALGQQIAKNLMFTTLHATADAKFRAETVRRLGNLARKPAPKGSASFKVLTLVGEKKDQGWVVRRRCIFQLFGAISSKLDPSETAEYLEQSILPPLYLATEGHSDTNEELKSLAQQVLELIQKCVGDEKFALAFAKVRSVFKARRDERSRKRKQGKVINPQEAARQKRLKSQRKMKSKKRKGIDAWQRRVRARSYT